MFNAVDNPHLVPFDGSFVVAETGTAPDKALRRRVKKRLKLAIKQLDKLQQVLMAGDNHSVLLVFQAMDAAGKDSTIRAVMQGINPAGCQVFSFKKPSSQELDHDFLWRTSKRLPERGRIGIFNRSQYEEVLVVRVHPEYLQYQKLPDVSDDKAFWEQRFESIRDQEKHLARNGTLILKFWLNVSPEEQRRRFLSRLDNPDKQWKFSPADIDERPFWPQYMQAYEDALNATSRPWAPWYAIPADDKPYMRTLVAETIVSAMAAIGLEYPEPDDDDRATFAELRAQLAAQDSSR